MKFRNGLKYFVFVSGLAGMLLITGCGNKSMIQNDELQDADSLAQDADSLAQGADCLTQAPGADDESGGTLPAGMAAEPAPESGSEPELGADAEQAPGADEEQTQGAVLETEGEEATPDADPETEDHVFQTWEAPLADGRILTLEAVGRQVDEYHFGVREVRVYNGDALLQTVLSSEGYWHEDYTSCWSAESAVEVLDLNFDGNMDFGLFGWETNNTIPFYYWTWDAEEECYRYAGTLQGAELLPETEEVACSGRSGWGSYWTYYYHPNADGELLLVRVVKEDSSEFDITEKGYYEGGAVRETWVPEEGVEISATDEEIPEEELVLIQREILFEEVHDEGVSYFKEIWELKDGELQMISREEVFL